MKAVLAAKSGRKPMDGKKSTEHHIIIEDQGILFAVCITEANRPEVTQLLVLVEGIPPIQGKRGRPRRRPKIVPGDCVYDIVLASSIPQTFYSV